MPKKFIKQAVDTVAEEGLLPALAEIEERADTPYEAELIAQEVIAESIDQGLFERQLLHDIVVAKARDHSRRKRVARHTLSGRRYY